MESAARASRLSVNSKSEFLSTTRKFWQVRATRPLTDEDARQIIENVAGVFTILAQWDENKKAGKDTTAHASEHSGSVGMQSESSSQELDSVTPASVNKGGCNDPKI